MTAESPLRILIVEDSPTAAELLLIQLEDGMTRPFRAVRAETLAEARDRLRNQWFDLVLLDLNLPDSYGLDTFLTLHGLYSNVPYVVLSAMAEESIALEAVRAGAQDYMVKSRLDDAQLINRAIQFSLERFRRVAVESELTTAQRVQNRLYPEAAPIVPGLDIFGRAMPAEHVSGDYFDFIPMTDGALGVVVGDVSGHGLGPALRMAETRASLHALGRAWHDLHDLATAHDDLCDILRRTNAVLSAADTGQFVSLFLAQLNPADHTFQYASAGHRAHLIRGDGTVEELESTGSVLGMFPDIDIEESSTFRLHSGDVLFIPTDGIEETHTADRRMFGKQQMLDVIIGSLGQTAETIFNHVSQAARDFADGHAQQDDMTAVVIRVL